MGRYAKLLLLANGYYTLAKRYESLDKAKHLLYANRGREICLELLRMEANWYSRWA